MTHNTNVLLFKLNCTLCDLVKARILFQRDEMSSGKSLLFLAVIAPLAFQASLGYKFGYCPAYVDSEGVPRLGFYCTMNFKPYGLQHVFCCGNITYRYCCDDMEKNFEGIKFSKLYLYWNQCWVVVVMIGITLVFVAVAQIT
ncbi:unnamed protein product [Owenia fusiformis]|uniref:Shisa N-terminal domain-containing protein n=1 Tax=Owenia fusiformis TaxID=6347 RepID=A0A8S4NCP6_OWEFU|nr:unnamed protein product [Owenia fusiformis]